MFQVDDQITQIETLYRQITGDSPRRSEKPYAPIPPEADAEVYVRDNLARLQGTLNQIWGGQSPFVAGSMDYGRPSPIRFNVFDDGKEWVCTFEMAGVRKEDVKVRVEAGRLDVEGFRRNPEANGHRPVHLELVPGRIASSLPLPPIKAETVRAALSNGLLTVRFAKGSLATERRDVTIEVG